MAVSTPGINALNLRENAPTLGMAAGRNVPDGPRIALGGMGFFHNFLP
jgi:hypothetical protein